MTRQNIPLGKIMGITIGLDYSWFVIFALLTWSLTGNYYPAEFKNWAPPLYWVIDHPHAYRRARSPHAGHRVGLGAGGLGLRVGAVPRERSLKLAAYRIFDVHHAGLLAWKAVKQA
jgi:hypothetical protein